MHAKLILSAIALLMASEMFADQLTPEEALARMNTTKSQSKGFATDKSSLQLTYTSTFKGNNTYYVFNKGNEEGYLILSADDCMPAVLGVVEGNSFDYDKLPDNMKWWLSQYDVTISNYSAKGKKYVSATKKKDIEPLLGDIQWNQWDPYNLLCPTIEGKETPTGCVATAMAQVMGMWQWPKRGYGKNEYDFDVEIGVDRYGDPLFKTIHLESDFTKSTYNWDKILPKYDGNETRDQNFAIAQLMYDCGVAANMGYNPVGSGAYLEDAVSALVKNFCYDKDIRLEQRIFYEDEVWENMVYDNISKGMPLIFASATHAFVCDGYQSDGNLFHFNWGWGGNSDGYFLITGNDPEKDEKDFYYNDTYEAIEAIFNIKPSATPYVEGSEGEFPLVITMPYDVVAIDNQTWEYMKTDRILTGREVYVGGSEFYLKYPGYVAHDYAIGIKFKNKSDEFIIPVDEDKAKPFSYHNTYSFIFPEDIIPTNGKYTVSFVYKDITAGNTEWKDAIYQSGIIKPEVEIVFVDNHPFCEITDAPELIYNGKKVTDGIIVRAPNVNDITIKMNVKALRPLSNDSLTMNVFSYSPYFDDYKKVNLPSAEVNTVQAVNASYSIKDLNPSGRYGIQFIQRFYDQYKLMPYQLVFTIQDASTGIETIPQAEEKAASETIYDIYGRKVSTMNRAGLYIKNGKKFLGK